MQVGDEHGVDIPVEGGIRAGGGAAQVVDARAEYRIGEQARPVHLDQQAGMTEVGDAGEWGRMICHAATLTPAYSTGVAPSQ